MDTVENFVKWLEEVFLFKSLILLRKIGAPGEIRTPDRLVRSQVLYPAELRAHLYRNVGGERGIRTLDGVLAPYSLSRGAPSATRPSLHFS